MGGIAACCVLVLHAYFFVALVDSCADTLIMYVVHTGDIPNLDCTYMSWPTPEIEPFTQPIGL